MFQLLWVYVLSVLKCIVTVTGYTGDAMLGPTDLVFLNMESCSDNNILELTVKQKKYNRTTYVLDFTLNVPFVVDDNVILELKGSLKKQGGYKPGSFYMKDKTCDMLKVLLGDMFTDMLQATGADDCPLPSGEHSATNYYFDNDKFVVPQLYGDYKMEVFIYKDDEQHGCYVIYYKLVPKEE